MVAVRDHRNDCSDAVFDMNTTYSFCVRSRITVVGPGSPGEKVGGEESASSGGTPMTVGCPRRRSRASAAGSREAPISMEEARYSMKMSEHY